MRSEHRFVAALRRVSLALGLATASLVASAATIDVINIDAPGVGFNDPTPAAPVGGNNGTTLGEQRQILFAYVANFWGQRLRSDVPIQVLATFDALPCDANSGVLGAAGAWNILRDFPNAARAGTWYPSALANKLAGSALIDDPDPFVSADIISFFNGDLGRTGCLEGLSFYMGLDGQATLDQIDLLTTVLHEFGHGLGFQTFTDDATGEQITDDPVAQPNGYPSIWDHLLYDPAQRKNWVQMNNGERVSSAITPRNLVWNGERVRREVPRVLDRGVAELFVTGKGLNRLMTVGTAQFGKPIDKHTLLAKPMALVALQTGAAGAGCTAFDAANKATVRGKAALIDRGGCAFTLKVKNAQDAGAAAVIIMDNGPGLPPPELVGRDDSIILTSVRVSRDDGAALKAALAATPPRQLPPFAVLFENALKLAGADYLNRVFMFTPSPNQPGSSVSHYDTLARPNLLMEPFAEPNQAIAVSSPKDLTLELLRDIGW